MKKRISLIIFCIFFSMQMVNSKKSYSCNSPLIKACDSLEQCKSGSKDNSDYQYELGEIYHLGKGVDKNLSEAFKWYQKAAEKNYFAAYRLGQMYAFGEAISRDLNEALKWYQQAAEMGHTESQALLADLYQTGDTDLIKKDLSEAFKWYQKAAELGHLESKNELGKMYYAGIGTEKDYAKSYSWLKLSGVQDQETKDLINNLEKKMTATQKKEAAILIKSYRRKCNK